MKMSLRPFKGLVLTCLLSAFSILLQAQDAPYSGYASKDYSQDSVVLTLQKATRGNGLNVVFMGDGFTDKHLKPGGWYERIMKIAVESYFSEEPVKSFREYFNVYVVKAVSPNGSFEPGARTALGVVVADLKKSEAGGILKYARKTPVSKGEHMDVVVIANTALGKGLSRYVTPKTSVSFVNMYKKGKSFNNRKYFRHVVVHEAVGHGLTRLGDEYTTEEDGWMTTKRKETRSRLAEKYDYYPNIDYMSHPREVKWSHFIGHPDYPEVGVFEGADRHIKGAYRPTINSLMNHSNYEYNVGFNAPSREAIYRKIKEWAGETYRWEDFHAYDAINRTKEKQVLFRTPAPPRNTKGHTHRH